MSEKKPLPLTQTSQLQLSKPIQASIGLKFQSVTSKTARESWLVASESIAPRLSSLSIETSRQEEKVSNSRKTCNSTQIRPKLTSAFTVGSIK